MSPEVARLERQVGPILRTFTALAGVKRPNSVQGRAPSLAWSTRAGAALQVALQPEVCYAHFHVCSGLELAIDNFCLRLFKEQDMNGALSEWMPDGIA